MPAFVIPLHERNDCHNPPGSRIGGRFCSDAVQGGTQVGLTSQRPEGDPGHKANRQVFQQMRQFETQLRALPGVRNVSVLPGVGAWEGGSEATWSVAYRGNGAASRLLAATARQYNQDAVLVMKGCSGAVGCSPATEWVFDHGFDSTRRVALEKVLRAAGAEGWVFLKRNGQSILRWVHTPQWTGMSVADYHQAVSRVTTDLRTRGLSRTVRRSQVKVEIIDREHNYAV